MEPCKICHSQDQVIAYEGPVRSGTYGKTTLGTVYRCSTCGVEYLPTTIRNLGTYYKEGAYRDDVGESPDIANYFKLHDDEQLGKYALLEGFPLRGQTIADVGCAGGSFLDGLSGFTSQTIGIEPAVAYHNSLKARGHLVYADISDTLREWRGRVNIVTCFSVIEHVKDPVALLQDIRELLAVGGVALLSTPNRDDILLSLNVEAYRSFYYRTAHIYYFNQESLRHAADMAGFPSFVAKYMHRFNFANFLGWLQEGAPVGNRKTTAMGSSFDRMWKVKLETSGVADYLYAYLRA